MRTAASDRLTRLGSTLMVALLFGLARRTHKPRRFRRPVPMQ